MNDKKESIANFTKMTALVALIQYTVGFSATQTQMTIISQSSLPHDKKHKVLNELIDLMNEQAEMMGPLQARLLQLEAEENK